MVRERAMGGVAGSSETRRQQQLRKGSTKDPITILSFNGRKCLVACVFGILVLIFAIRVSVFVVGVGKRRNHSYFLTEPFQIPSLKETDMEARGWMAHMITANNQRNVRIHENEVKLKERKVSDIALVRKGDSLEPPEIKKVEYSYSGRNPAILATVKDLQAIAGRNEAAYHSLKGFLLDMKEMTDKFKVFLYPHSPADPFRKILDPVGYDPSGNYASESYFKKALLSSHFVTKDPSKADLFYLPFSISGLRNDRRVGVRGIQDFVKMYMDRISHAYPYWNRSNGADHFYVVCHSVGRTAMDKALQVRINAIQVVCSSNYHVHGFVPHKDVPIPQIWPRTGTPKETASISQRKTLAFFAGGANSPVRASLVKTWANDSDIRVYSKRISSPYSDALLTSKFCLHVKGYEVNTARIGDAMYYGCVPVIIADHYDLPFNDILVWKRFSVVVSQSDIPMLKTILSQISDETYARMHSVVMELRKHFQWHSPPKEFDAFYTVMYELWLRRHVLRSPITT